MNVIIIIIYFFKKRNHSLFKSTTCTLCILLKYFFVLYKDELEQKHHTLLSTYAEDLQTVQLLFHELKSSPPAPQNLPPISGALYWARGLLQRINIPMGKMKQLNKALMEKEESNDIVKMYGPSIFFFPSLHFLLLSISFFPFSFPFLYFLFK